MNKVEKLGINMWESRWESGEKVSTFLTNLAYDGEAKWKMFGFARVLQIIYTAISTENLFGFYGVEGVDLHIST